MKLGIGLLIAGHAAASPASALQSGRAVSESWVVDAFASLCFEPFGDPSKMQDAVSAYRNGVFSREGKPMPAKPPFFWLWSAPNASLTYINNDGLTPPDLSSPQCALTADVGAEFDHSAAAAGLQARLPIGEGKTRGRSPRLSTEWAFAGPNGAKREMAIIIEPGKSGPHLFVILSNRKK